MLETVYRRLYYKQFTLQYVFFAQRKQWSYNYINFETNSHNIFYKIDYNVKPALTSSYRFRKVRTKNQVKCGHGYLLPDRLLKLYELYLNPRDLSKYWIGMKFNDTLLVSLRICVRSWIELYGKITNFCS